MLCKLSFPLYCCECLDENHFVVAGGGGAAKTGVHNSVQILELSKQKKKCLADPVAQVDTGVNAVMNLSVSQLKANQKSDDAFLLAIGIENQCHVFTVEKTASIEDVKQPPQEGLTRRKKSSNKKTKEPSQNESTCYKFKLKHELKSTIPKQFQTSVKLSLDGCILVTGSSDGRLQAWKLPGEEKLFEYRGHKEEITGVDISHNSKHIVSVSRDGEAFLWDLKGDKTSELHSIWNMEVKSRLYRFRNCCFGTVPGQSDRVVLFTSHCPIKPTRDSVCCLTKWSQPRDKEESGSDLKFMFCRQLPKKAISSMAISRNGVFLGVGFMDGSVSIFISFSLQCSMTVKDVHNIFVTSLSFLNDTPDTLALTGHCDTAMVSVSADGASNLTKLSARNMASVWFVMFLCIVVLAATALFLKSENFI